LKGNKDDLKPFSGCAEIEAFEHKPKEDQHDPINKLEIYELGHSRFVIQLRCNHEHQTFLKLKRARNEPEREKKIPEFNISSFSFQNHILKDIYLKRHILIIMHVPQ